MKSSLPPELVALLERGVLVPHPSSVYVDPSVDPSRIAEGVVLYPGTRLGGASLSLGPGCQIGGETPATVLDCQVGHGVSLKGGFFQGSVFLDKSSMGSSAHVRPGCLLEEEASGAHAVGLKQTVLLSFVTLGSLVNFCDVLMAGGRGRRDHSEVGSSFIHFNFTPHGDKATPSLVGDVPRGVLLGEEPIFLGGQGGMVGPVSVAYGVVQAAGTVLRRDLHEPGHLYQSGGAKERLLAYAPGRIRDFPRRVEANLRYIGNLLALRAWYQGFRARGAAGDPWRKACVEGATRLLAESVEERCRQVDKLSDLVGGPAARRWTEIREEVLARAGSREPCEQALADLHPGGGAAHPAAVASLGPEQKQRITLSLVEIVDGLTALAGSIPPP